MKGTPPFTRHDVERKFNTRTLAGHKPQMEHAKRLAGSGPFKLMEASQALWLTIDCGTGVVAALRLQEKDPHVSKVRLSGKGETVVVRTSCLVGDYEVKVVMTSKPCPEIRATVTLTTREPVKLDSTTPEVILTDEKHQPLLAGRVFTYQTGPTAGQAFVSARGATLYYFQNLSALASYSSLTGARMESSVKVEWPAVGFVLPQGDDPLPAKKKVVISDAFIRLTHGSDDGEATRAEEFLDGLAWVYRETAPPPGPWFDWAATAARTLRALTGSKQCLRGIKGKRYLNAYVGSDYKPPESMVQGAIEVPLAEYENWLSKPDPLGKLLKDNLAAFYLHDLKTMSRWLPGGEFANEDRPEEQEMERMDSWYLLHTMMNVGRLAELGKVTERKLFIDALGYVVRVARHFDYDWPVFYHRKTLRVVKREVEGGMGGERDAAGLYAHVMLQAWDLTGDRAYLDEAEKAAAKLVGLGFGVLYQTNNTVFTAIALGRLWKATGNAVYKNLCIVCLASVLSHLWLWEAPSNGRPWRTYMGLPPLHDARYIAPYEEGEVFATTRVLLLEMGKDLPASLHELLTEYGKHLLGRARFYLPSELPPEHIAGEPREGVIERRLPVPLEDLYSDTSKAGQVGQEVYGAALALILATRSFYRWRRVPFTVWCAAPLVSSQFEIEKGAVTICFLLEAPGHFKYEIRILPSSRRANVNALAVSTQPENGSSYRKLRTARTEEGHLRFEVNGGTWVRITSS